MGCLIDKFFIYESVPPSKADSHHFKNMIVSAQQVDHWDRTLKHPLHAAVGIDPDLLQAVHEVFTKLDPTSEDLSQFGNEISDMEVENDKVAKKYYLDLLDIAAELVVTSRPSFDSMSVEHSSRPSVTDTFASGYDCSRGEGTNDGSDPGNDERDVRQQQQSGQPLTFTCEDDFTHCIQDEDHNFRRTSLGVGSYWKAI
ncbi:hypothetical protein CK203_100705 [Vitis vinifera]|uniref:Uncharacterized protein n=1 Tax=Vitis vinifera TaxID=29760 RepID=A0A438FI31_VITVI|nr:hypothetical protein CK203_100705 [Vitis vinifera]